MAHKKLNLSQSLLKRDSFSDRICDDLCEVLLSYLSLEDKFRFECVSKQFQRCVYNKQNCIEIRYSSVKSLNSIHKLVARVDFYTSNWNLKALENVLNKCKFINEVYFECEHFENALPLIAEKCKYLNKFGFSRIISQLCYESLLEFGHKCGQQLIEISLSFDNYNYKKLINLCPNLLTIKAVRLNDLVDNNRVLVPKLTRIEDLLIEKETQKDSMKVFADNYMDSLEILKFQNDFGSTSIDYFMKQLSRFVNLEKLHMNFFSYNNNSFVHNIESIGINCSKISELQIWISFIMDGNHLSIPQMFNKIGVFTHLKSLDISISNAKGISIESFKNCKSLKRLHLSDERISDKVFENIDILLPQLTHLYIYSDEITDFTMNSLAKLDKLKVIEIDHTTRYRDKDERPSSKGVLHIIKNCPQIQSIRFVTTAVTLKTIDALIGLALKNPSISFNHSFRSLQLKRNRKTQIYRSLNSFPYNLNLTINGSKDWIKFFQVK